MRAVQYARTGDSSVLELVTRPWPARKKGQVVVQNIATSVNPVDAKVRWPPPPAAAALAEMPACRSATLGSGQPLPLLTTTARMQLRSGMGGRLAGPRLPAVPGGDVAGVVAEADAGSAFKPGGACSSALALPARFLPSCPAVRYLACLDPTPSPCM